MPQLLYYLNTEKNTIVQGHVLTDSNQPTNTTQESEEQKEKPQLSLLNTNQEVNRFLFFFVRL
jgi:GH24 family phage-related lysozyme (muramidase)